MLTTASTLKAGVKTAVASGNSGKPSFMKP
jgi:hypothetical protein